jgi:hypothetical protein
MQAERIGDSQQADLGRPSIDINRQVTQSMVFSSLGEASTAHCHMLQISNRQEMRCHQKYPRQEPHSPSVVTRTFSDGRTDDRTMAAGATVT